MKDIYRNPTLYYVVVPFIAVLWPLLVWAVYLPQAQRSWKSEKSRYDKAQGIMADILTLDPDRLDFTDSGDSVAEFDYVNEVDRIATLCKISPTNYKLSSGIIISSGVQKSRSARLVIKQVSIAKFARFLSAFQLRWSDLQCTKVKLTKGARPISPSGA